MEMPFVHFSVQCTYDLNIVDSLNFIRAIYVVQIVNNKSTFLFQLFLTENLPFCFLNLINRITRTHIEFATLQMMINLQFSPPTCSALKLEKSAIIIVLWAMGIGG